MADHFGGEWTKIKLDSLRKYLNAYLTIFRTAIKARNFKILYIDAFAGNGENIFTADDNSLELSLFSPEEKRNEYPGSARIALELDKKFDKYIFIELEPENCSKLKSLISAVNIEGSDVEVIQGDSNIELRNILAQYDWRRYRAVLFLDPFGMQVDFATLKSIAKTRAIDVWLLVPLGVGVMRLLKNNGQISEANKATLTRFFGCDDWYNELYKAGISDTLFGEEEFVQKTVNFQNLIKYYGSRLGEIFGGISPDPLLLKNSRGNTIFALYFMVANQDEKVKHLAINIANSIIKKKHG